MDWKLTRGKFRPKLQALIGSNTEEAVKVASKAGLAVMSSAEPHAEPAEADLREAVKQLTKLKVRIAGCNLCAETPFQSSSPQVRWTRCSEAAHMEHALWIRLRTSIHLVSDS